MKVVFLKKNNFKEYNLILSDGFLFKPINKNIEFLNVISRDIIEYVLNKKIRNEICKIKKAILLIINCDVAIKSDCDMMLYEIKKIIFKIENKYLFYINEFDYFENIKEIIFIK